ncbi:MAG: NADH-quinone oxidoreductase subunit D [Bacteroidaceae bacterium]|nr:NADH-quinone oxidoreductase subunit D [Bacteroidaceae bacterium]
MEITRISTEQFHAEMVKLREKGFDLLRNLTGMDWQEEGLGAVYQLENTATGENIAVSTSNTDREEPYIPSVCDIWKIAEFYEREAYDFLGIIFVGHPDMRRLFLRDDWQGFPLRKDYDASEEINPIRMYDEPTVDDTVSYQVQKNGEVKAEKRVLFADDEYVINVGPQHPATHGVLHFRLSLDGEIIKKADMHCGYIHRGIEKINESLTYQQTLGLTDRLDYLSAMQNRHALCMAIEKGLELELTDRIQYIRTIMDELQRIDSHLLFFSCCAQDLGALTAFIYGFRDREKVLDLLEEVTGGRLIQTYNVIGGVQADITAGWAAKVKEFCKYLRPMIEEYNAVFTGNVIMHNRLKGVGVLSREDAIAFGCTGGTGRASGWACDVRKRHPYAMYSKVDFKEIVYNNGDSFDRYMVRIDEMEQSLRIIEQLIDNIPEGDFKVKTKPIIKVPEGTYYAAVEGSRGEFGVFLESKGDKSPYRLKYRPMGLPLIAAMNTIVKGSKLADLIAIGATLDYVIPDIDR